MPLAPLLALALALLQGKPAPAKPAAKANQAAPPEVRDLVTFADAPGKGFLPLREVAKAFGRWAGFAGGKATLDGAPLDPKALRKLGDGTLLVPLSLLQSHGLLVGEPKGQLVALKDKKHPGRFLYARHGQKRVFVNKREQTLVAFEGQRKVLTTRVSTGREGKETPTGIFKAQAYKDRFHKSRLHNDAPMPWSVQIVGNVFIHGFKSVPGRAASSGCIRVPLTGENPARWFYYWVEPGTPVSLLGKWPKNVERG